MRAIGVLLLFFLAAPAWAEWVVITKTRNGTVFYIDPQTIQKDGDLRRVSTLMNLKEKNKDGKQSARALEEYACKTDQNRVLSYSDHSEPFALGETLMSQQTPSEWKSLAPGTVGQAILVFVCHLVEDKADPADNSPPVKAEGDDWWRYEGKAKGSY
jgi:hypothetical protein